MNRKITLILLAVLSVFCLAFAAACNTGNTLTKSETLQNYIFTDDGKVVTDDFTLPVKIGYYKATWTSDSDYIQIGLNEDGDAYIAEVTIPDEGNITVTLTVDLRGATKEFTVRLRALTTQDFIDNYNFIQKRATVYGDFALDEEAYYDQEKYPDKVATIEWLVSDETSQGYISVENNNTCKVITSSLNPEVKINAIFTYNGVSAETFYVFTVSEEMTHLQEVDYWYTNTNISVDMKGYVVAVATAYSTSYSNISFYMIDENFDAGYYIYRGKCDATSGAAIVPGVYVEVTGSTNTNYKGLIETNSGATVTVDATKTIDVSDYVQAIDTDLMADAPATIYNESRLVSVSNWTVQSVYSKAPSTGSTSTLFTLVKNGQTVSVAVSKYLEGAYSTSDSDATFNAFVEKYNEMKTAFEALGEGGSLVVSVTGILGNYNGYQILPLSADDIVIGGTVGEDDAVAAQNVSAAIAAVEEVMDSTPALIADAYEATLPQAAADGAVTISYELLGTRSAFVVTDGKLVVTPGAREAATMQVTITCGDYTTYLFWKMTSEKLDDAGKAKYEASQAAIDFTVSAAGDYTLPAAQYFVDDAAFAWSVDASEYPYASTNDGVLTIADLPLAETKMTLTLTVTVGGSSYTREFYVSVPAMDTTVCNYITDEADLVAGEYYFGLYQGGLYETLYATGSLTSNGYYLATTTDASEAKKITLAVVDGGYTLSVGGKYIEVIQSGSYYNPTLVDASTGAWTWNSTYNVLVWTVGETEVYIGAYSTYETFSASKSSYLSGDTNYAARLVKSLETGTAESILAGIIGKMETTVTEDFTLDYNATWTLKEGSGIELDGLTAKVTQTSAEQTAVLTATLTYNGETATQDVTFTVSSLAKSFIAIAYEAGDALENKATTEDYYYIIGTVAKITYAYTETNGNVSFTVTDGTYTVTAYKYNLDDASTIAVGDTVSFAARIQKYGTTIEAISGFYAVELTTLADAAAAGVAGTGAEGTAVYGQVTEINTAYSSNYNNISFTISDGTDTLYCYRVKGGSDITVGAYVLVTGTPGAYKGAGQMTAGATYNLTAIYTVPEVEPTKATLAEFVAASDSDTVYYQVEGVVTKIVNESYQSCYITDGTTTLYVYAWTTVPTTVEVGKHIVIKATKTTFSSVVEAKNAALVGDVTEASDLEMVYVAAANLTVDSTATSDITLPTYDGATITWTANGEAVNGTTVTVTQTSEEQTITLVATIVVNTATMSYNYTVTVPAAIVGEKITFDYVADFATYASSWSSTYAEYIAELNGYTTTLSRGSKQTGTITDRPVLAANAGKSAATVYVTINMSSTEVTAAEFVLAQWSDKKTFSNIQIEYSTDGTTWTASTDASASNTTNTWTDGAMTLSAVFDTPVTYVRLAVTTTSTGNQQVGLTSATVVKA